MSLVVDVGVTKSDSGGATAPWSRVASAGRVRRTAEKFGGVARQFLRLVGRPAGQPASNYRAEPANTTAGSPDVSAKNIQGDSTLAKAGSVRLSARISQVDSGTPRMRSAPLHPLRSQRRAGANTDEPAINIKTVD